MNAHLKGLSNTKARQDVSIIFFPDQHEMDSYGSVISGGLAMISCPKFSVDSLKFCNRMLFALLSAENKTISVFSASARHFDSTIVCQTQWSISRDAANIKAE